MHYHCEIIMPPTHDVEAAVNAIMARFDENAPDDKDGDHDARFTFWDWYVIGGRWSGHKLLARLDAAKLDEFQAMLTKMEVTVSGVQAGKPSLQPESQIAEVDRLWVEHFPDAGFTQCPLFKHYTGTMGDVCRVEELPEGLTASRVIVAGLDSDGNGLRVKTMQQRDAWNGVNILKTAWDGKIAAALAAHAERISWYRDDLREALTVKPDWLAVTVDYHS